MGKHSSLSEETEERADSQRSEDPHDKFTKGGKQSKVNKYNEKKGKTEGRNHPQVRSVHPLTEPVYHNMSHKGNKNYKGKKVGGIIFAPLRPNQWGRNKMEISGKSTKSEKSKHSQSNNKNKDGLSDTQIPESSQQEKKQITGYEKTIEVTAPKGSANIKSSNAQEYVQLQHKKTQSTDNQQGVKGFIPQENKTDMYHHQNSEKRSNELQDPHSSKHGKRK